VPGIGGSLSIKRLTMHRRAGTAFGTALAFVAGFSVACGPGEAPEATVEAEPHAVEVAQTTPATQPVVTVYKSPT
jgi:hypothetical protein